MSLLRGVKRQLKAVAPSLLFLGLTAYFGWNALNGDRGLKASVVRTADLQRAKVELARAEADRDIWQRKVAGLQSQHLDPDTLDERARAMLNLAEPDEIVVPYGKNERLF